jgi:hypothetical protein
VHDLDQAWPRELSRQLFELSRMSVLTSGRSHLADCAVLRPADLARHRIWAPTLGTSPEFTGWWRRAGQFLGIELETAGRNIGLGQAIADINADPARVALLPGQMMLAGEPGVAALIPLDEPAMLFGWSMIWRTDERNSDVTRLLRNLTQLSRQRGWTAFRPGLDWLPEPDLADMKAV